MSSSETVIAATGADAKKRWRRSLGALGGVAAQGSQALASLTLQVLAARLLGVEGLGLFAALYAFVVMATAVSSGFVGDSLTVLERGRDRIRAALQLYWVGLSLGLGVVVGAGTWGSGFLDGPSAFACGLATTMFLFEDTLRRLLMATILFWRIVIVDLAVLGATVAWVGILLGLGLDVTLAQLLLGMAVGQTVGALLAVFLLPRQERRLAPWRRPDWGAVARYGSWRALQQVVRPTMLAGVRVAVVTVVSLTAAGQLEAARIYMAPAMIVVTGVSSVLFANYALDRAAPLRQQLRRVDLNVVVLLAAVVALCLVAIVGIPWLAPLLTDGDYELSVLAVVGWAAYAAATAASTPYGQLAAVRGHHVAVLLIRVADAVISLGTAIAMISLGVDVAMLPMVLAVGALAGGMAMRWLLSRSTANLDEALT